MRFGAKHLVVAALFALAQICISALAAEHLTDPLHADHECSVCITIGDDTDGALPPSPEITIYPVSASIRAHFVPTQVVLTRHATSDKARAPPAFA
ncbi:MAG: hypothetical protein ABJG15_15045 [Hyphomonadaceae bacterium]